jgi:DNA-binding beta-propeller fold protein YncE
MIPRPLPFLAALLAALATSEFTRAQSYVNFESHQTRPICLSPDGTRLFAVNTPDARLSVFDVSNPANPAPVLIAEIPVGLEPVSVNARSNDEVWVVNEAGDSVSVVSVSAGAVTDTLVCPDEPADVVFAASAAWVTCSRNNLVRVFNLTTHAELTALPLQGLNPRSLAVSLDGTKVYAAFALSGNRTTLLPANLAPPQPPPTNQALPAPPDVGLIVSADDSRLNPKPNMPDNDLVEMDAATRTVIRYFKGTGTVNFAVAVRPVNGDVWVANTEARNLIRFEPNVRGHLVDHRITKVNPAGAGTVTPFDLNPGIDYNLLPNDAAKQTALAQPTALVFEASGLACWVAAFGSDRVARFDTVTGAVLTRIETGPTTGSAADPAHKRGPRGLALQATTGRLFVLNRLSNSLTVIDTQGAQVLGESSVGRYDPTPDVIRRGRGFLYDARLSGNGTQSCAVCHIDGDRDELAWDLGDPGGSMQTVTQPNPVGGGLQSFQMHPMKGPMTTQTLRGLSALEPFHWRGDRADFTAFNGAFASLLGGTVLSTSDMNLYRDFINTIVFQPNPNQNLDRTMPSSVTLPDGNTGNPNTGRNTYINDQYQPQLRCNTCHALPTGSNGVIIPSAALQISQDFKVPQLRNAYQKNYFVRNATTVSLSGFGFVHDGVDPDIFTFLSRPVFGVFANDTTRKRNLSAFLQCFDTGMAPAVGYARSVRDTTLAAAGANWTLLEAQAAAGNVDFVLIGIFNGKRHGFRYRPATNDYVSDEAGLGPFTRAALEGAIGNGTAALTLLGVPPGNGVRFAIDRDGDGIANANEPLPALNVAFSGGVPQLAWPAAQSALVLEYTDTIESPNWQPVLAPRLVSGNQVLAFDPGASGKRFYRLRVP